MIQAKRICEELLVWDGDASMLDGVPYTGVAFLTFPNGSVKRELSFENGFQEGECKVFFPSGVVQKQWTAKGGGAHGEMRECREDGQLKSIGVYEFGTELSFDEWDLAGTLVESRRIDKDSELMKYVETIRGRPSK